VDRRDFILSLFDHAGFGLEVGPSYEPLLPKSAGYNVEVVDHADTETLRKKYRNLPSVDASRIETVDYVSDGRSLIEIIGQEERYDYVLACHAIEHVTDIVRFLQDCEKLLKPGGRLVLVVPDKRFCFDALLPVSTVGQALQVYHEGRSRHSPGRVFDHISMRSRRNGADIWLEADLDGVELLNSKALAQGEFERLRNSDDYVDIHGWQFTPSSFRYLIKSLRELGYIQSGELAFKKNGPFVACAHEFYISLSKDAPGNQETDIGLLKAVEAELSEITPSAAAASDAQRRQHEINRLASELAATRSLLDHERHDNAALRASTSWRLTSPLRYLRSMVGPATPKGN
jgi:predicted SAM-dependent methyltransferase